MNNDEVSFWKQWRASFENGKQIDCLKSLKLGTEAHHQPVTTLRYNWTSSEYKNLIAAVGGNQVMDTSSFFLRCVKEVTVYDDTFLGSHVNIVAQFTNVETAETKGGGLGCCAWVMDALDLPYLAVAGEDPNISLISLVEARVVSILKGHQNPVIALEGIKIEDATFFIASLDVGGCFYLWDPFRKYRMASLQNPDMCLMCSLYGRRLLVGDGLELRELKFSRMADHSISMIENPIPLSAELNLRRKKKEISRALHLKEDDLALLLNDGHIHVVSLHTKEIKSTFKYHIQRMSMISQWTTSQNGEAIAIGGESNSVTLVDSEKAQIQGVAEMPSRLSGPIFACALSMEVLHLWVSAGNGCICRFEYELENDPA